MAKILKYFFYKFTDTSPIKSKIDIRFQVTQTKRNNKKIKYEYNFNLDGL